MMTTTPRIAILGRESPFGFGALECLRMSTFQVRMEGCETVGSAQTKTLQVQEVDRRSNGSLDRFFNDVQGLVYANPVDRYLHLPEAQALKGSVAELRRVFESAKRNGVQRIVYFSSIHTVCAGDGEPENCHAFATGRDVRKDLLVKLEAEVYRYVAQGVDAVILNPGEALGFSFQKSYTFALLQGLLSTNPVPLVLPDVAIRLVDSRDAGNALIGALKRGRTGRRYVLTGVPTTTPDLIESIQRLLPSAKYRRIVWVQAKVMENLPRRFSTLCGLQRTQQWRLNQFLLHCQELTASSSRGEQELGYSTRRMDETIAGLVRDYQRLGGVITTSKDR